MRAFFLGFVLSACAPPRDAVVACHRRAEPEFFTAVDVECAKGCDPRAIERRVWAERCGR